MTTFLCFAVFALRKVRGDRNIRQGSHLKPHFIQVQHQENFQLKGPRVNPNRPSTCNTAFLHALRVDVLMKFPYDFIVLVIVVVMLFK
jgi:hypothetical protein